MTSLTFVTLLQASLLAADDDSYAEAHKQAKAGRPLVVLVSTEWCPPCQTMKKTVIPEVRKRGIFKKVAFAVVNPERERKLAQRLTGAGTAIPQLLMFRKTPKGWARRKLVGSQSVATVEKFIQQGIELDEATKKESGDEAPQVEVVSDPTPAESPDTQ